MQALVYPAYGELEVRSVPEPRPEPGEVLVAAPARIVYRMPEGMTAVQGALVEPLANGIHVLSLAADNPLETVIVIGAGPIGLMCLQAALLRGANRVAVSEPNPQRREVAVSLGAATAWDPRDGSLATAAARFTDGQGADLVIDAVGSAETKRDSVTAARPGGDIVWIGLHGDEVTLASFDLVLAERRLSGSYGAGEADIRAAIQWFSEGKVPTEPWVETVPLSRGAEAFFAALRQEGNAVKIVLEPGR